MTREFGRRQFAGEQGAVFREIRHGFQIGFSLPRPIRASRRIRGPSPGRAADCQKPSDRLKPLQFRQSVAKIFQCEGGDPFDLRFRIYDMRLSGPQPLESFIVNQNLLDSEKRNRPQCRQSRGQRAVSGKAAISSFSSRRRHPGRPAFWPCVVGIYPRDRRYRRISACRCKTDGRRCKCR